MADHVQSVDRLGRDPLGKLIRELALPGIVAQIINLLYNIVDRIYIGRIPEVGSQALSGLGICMPIILVAAAFASFASSGSAPLASISMGEGDMKTAERHLATAAGFMLVTSVVITALGLIFIDPLLYFFGALPGNFIHAKQYLGIYLIGTVFVLGTLALNSFISAQGHSKIAMRTVMIGAVSNIILDPIFIFLFNMGVRGAAVATVISQGLSFLSIILFLRSENSRLRLTSLKIDPALLRKALKLGVSGFTMSATGAAVALIFNRLLGIHGNELHISAMVIMQSILQMIFIPLNGYTMGVQPLLSYNYGARKFDRVNRVLKISFIFLVGFAFIGAMLAILFPRFIGGIFTGDEKLLHLVGKYMPIFLAGMPIFGMQMVAQMFFVGSNQPKYAIFLASLRKLILLIPLCFILAHYMGLIGIYIAEPIADSISATTAGILLLTQVRRMRKAFAVENDNKKAERSAEHPAR